MEAKEVILLVGTVERCETKRGSQALHKVLFYYRICLGNCFVFQMLKTNAKQPLVTRAPLVTNRFDTVR